MSNSSVSFVYDQELVALRRKVAPNARWDAIAKTWSMSASDVDAFRAACESVSKLRNRGITIWVNGDKLYFKTAQEIRRETENNSYKAIGAGVVSHIANGKLVLTSCKHYIWLPGVEECLRAIPGLKFDTQCTYDDNFPGFVGEVSLLDVVCKALESLQIPVEA